MADLHEVRAEVGGRVWKVEVAVGQAVAEGDTLLVVESMKMEIPLAAPCAGTVQAIQAAEGDMVEEDQVLVVLAG
ncbi:acetyl-CoA carboxylase biotin carboxyl carrier protein subunit [Piscinibacter gummiphilus]|uniref:Acetyl-CoA carboxylase biotin carboxyl carrier protein subunit n=1 Tax=Piscinibacter gummiphilus TaxID=946333 RepID=A0A1W6LER1_9BURK|nr:acetyl-CoA carboxylase biotin carboxyl carrier protein subunit [Piscinibacter gummiphilus]ARN22764.1 acetyl-CoA carboxylase biotin carboxyl carrier protein subunit [Piscinibacter gummiphilus]ATU67460.1 acetyl-CoA carboxylase biotin carboxyl carrier protein subunit [Piscinibacter gummiphilus]GLS96572.1 acetyl-CoA carboxylase biotin carboxyl carrier protein subunit [Piscinibacter gummiphilus]